MNWNGLKITWLGHATFLFETRAGKKILVDPWLEQNPRCPDGFHEAESDAILVTHGHFDHVGDLFSAAKRCSGPIVGSFEIGAWAQGKGVDADRVVQMNKGGTVRFDDLGVAVTVTDARHSSSFVEDDGTIVYLGEPVGYVLSFDDGPTVYLAGDTCLFSGMEFLHELHSPNVAILPIGDHFTMDPKAAAVACRLVKPEVVIPAHFGTFDALTGTPEQLERELKKQNLPTQVQTLKPGEAFSG